MSRARTAAVDPALLALFREEARGGAQRLLEGIEALTRATDPAPILAQLANAAHSIKGAARIVQIAAAGRLTDAIEGRIERIKAGDTELTPSEIALLRDAGRLAARFGEDASPEDADFENALDSTVTALSRADGIAAPASDARVGSAPRGPLEPKLVELFRLEVEQCTSTLSQRLVALESDPSSAAGWEDAMRAAHSVKGAAKILRLSAFERLAHILEERLIQAQQSPESLSSGEADVMLMAIDAMATVGHNVDASGAGVDELERLCARALEPLELAASPSASTSPSRRAEGVVRKRHISVVPPLETPPALRAQPMTPAASDPSKRVLRVAAQSIDRLMGLAGESLVEARRVASFDKFIDRMRKRQAALGNALEELELALATTEAGKRLAEAKERARECAELFVGHATEVESYTRRAEELSERLYREALKSRMRPFADGTHAFPRLVRDLAKQLGKQVRFEILGSQTEVDRDVLESLEAPLNHLLRNALDHGLEAPEERRQAGKAEQATLRLEARHHAGVLTIAVSDDGRGIDPEKIRARAVERGLVNGNLAATLNRGELLEFLFLPSFTTARAVTDVSGRGIGLDVVKSVVEAVSGTVRVTSDLNRGTTFHLQLPVTRSVARALVADIAGDKYAFPLLRIERVLRLPVTEVRLLENRQYFVLDDVNVALIDARQLLGADRSSAGKDTLSVVVIGERTQRFGIIVEEFSGEHDLVVHPLDPRLGKVQDIGAAAILADGSPALIVDVDDLIRSIDRALRSGSLVNVGQSHASAQVVKKRILVVDDSITVREAERQLLVNRGYEVDVALDGIDALNSIRRARYDLIITDIDMPRLNGIELVKTIKQDSSLKDIPIVIVSYKDRSEDRLRGLDAGANYYLTKSSFHDEKLLEAVTDLIGEAAA